VGPIAVGVDAGGTSTTAVAACAEGLLESCSGEAANASSLGFDRAAATIAEVVAGTLSGETPAVICVGAAGAGRAEVADGLRTALQRQFPGAHVCVCDDARIALRAAVPTGDGFVLIAGTGSIAYGEVADASYRAGGYGYLLGDEGSGFAIGAAAVRSTLRAFDGRAPRDPFVNEVAAALEAHGTSDILQRVYRSSNPVSTLAALAPLVLTAADRGERIANKIVQNAALELYDLIKSVVRTAGVVEGALPIVLAGGLLRVNSLLTYLLETRLANELPLMEVRKNAPEPHFGALALAQGMLAT
jgi:N-acetylglucosamine kinase-like BadF-type ATPase